MIIELIVCGRHRSGGRTTAHRAVTRYHIKAAGERIVYNSYLLVQRYAIVNKNDTPMPFNPTLIPFKPNLNFVGVFETNVSKLNLNEDLDFSRRIIC